MISDSRSFQISRTALWAGRIASGLAAAFMGFDGIIHLAKPVPVAQAFNELGFPLSLSATLGIVELLITLIYLYPRTSALGAILFTGYLGGAVCIQMRAEHPLFSQTLFPVYIGIILWGGIYLRKPGVRALIPFVKSTRVAAEMS